MRNGDHAEMPQSHSKDLRTMIGLRSRALGLLVLVGVLAGLPAEPAPMPKPGEAFQVAAPNAILIEAESGSVLFEKGADALVPPASLSKLMTAEVVFHAIKEGRLKAAEEFLVSANAWRKGGAPSRTSSMFIPINTRVTIDELLHGVIIQSANDACIAIAEGMSGNEDRFAEVMTDRAREIGLAKSTFGNATGLPHPKQLMSVRELGQLARHIVLSYPEYYSYYGEREYTYNKIRQYNRNPLLTLNIGADGMKTGFIKVSGYGIVGSAVQNGMRLLVVATGYKSEKERADETKKLLEWGFQTFQQSVLFNEGQIIADAKTYGANQRYVPLVAKYSVRLMVPRGVRERITARVVYSGPVRAPIRKGQK